MHRLYIRIYLAVLLALAVFAALVSLTWFVFIRDEVMFRPGGQWTQASAELLADALPADAPVEVVASRLRRWHERTDADVVLLDSDHRLIAAAGDPPEWATKLPPPKDPALSGRLRDEHESVFRLVLPDGRTLLMRTERFFGPPRGPPGGPRGGPPGRGPGGIVFWLVLMALAVGVGAYPVVRRLTRRLERLQHGVDALGAGDLTTRVDVTGRDEVAVLAASFNRSAERIESLVAAQKSLLANASHELRSPLARLRMALAMLPEDIEPRLRVEVDRDIAELDALIDEVLLASRLDATARDAAQADTETADWLAICAEECARTPATLAAVDGALPPVRAEDRLLRRLVRNLLENARRHARGQPIDVALVRVGDRVRLEVADRGPGVPEAERERIFEPFYRARGASEADGGVGLGLALVRGIARRHGGEVVCLPRDGGGSIFRVELPAAA